MEQRKNFLAGIAYSVSNSKENSGDVWDGALIPQDILEIAKMADSQKSGETVYDMVLSEAASTVLHVSKFQILRMQDSASQKETFRNLRKLLPGFFDSERQIDKLKSTWQKEFNVVLKPERTTTGWSIDPKRLHQCIHLSIHGLKM